LERDPEKRFATCAQFADALEAAATQRDGIAMSRELAAYVREVMGQEIEQQRDAVRAWLARSEPSQASGHEIPSAAVPSSSVSAAAMFIPGDERSKNLTQPTLSTMLTQPRSRAPLVIGTLLLLALVGAGGFLVARTAHQGSGPAPAIAPASSPTLPAATPTAKPSAAASSSAEPGTLAVSPEALSLETNTPVARQRAAPAAPGSARQPAPRPKKPKPDGLDISNPYR
ncbi:MAG TPA: hypothetical protein VGP93_20040, partial [Polyangiaceae bacterium]|nr:hypothetical protein [Polyangiaceae bacterium]